MINILYSNSKQRNCLEDRVSCAWDQKMSLEMLQQRTKKVGAIDITAIIPLEDFVH